MRSESSRERYHTPTEIFLLGPLEFVSISRALHLLSSVSHIFFKEFFCYGFFGVTPRRLVT